MDITRISHTVGLSLLCGFAMCFALMGAMRGERNAFAQRDGSTDRLQLQRIFRAELGRYDRQRIARYLAYTDLPYGHEWCAAFVSYCFGQLGQEVPRTPWSPSLFPRSRLVWTYAENRAPPPQLRTGMLWGIYVAGKKRIGHVGFVDSYQQGILTTVEGNTNDPEGKGLMGVYRKRRHWRTIHSVSDWMGAR